MTHKLSRLLLGIGGLALGLALVVLLDVTPYIRGGFGWRWPFAFVGVGGLLLFLAAALVYAVAAYVAMTRIRKTAVILLWAFLGAAILPYVALSLRHSDIIFEVLSRTLSGMATGYHPAAAGLDWSADTLVNWPSIMANFAGTNVHMTTSPPGGALFYVLVSRLSGAVPGLAEQAQTALLPYQCDNFNVLYYTPSEWAAALFGMLMPLWGALAVFPLYTITKRLSSREQGWQVAIWWVLVPSLSMFVSSQNTVFPLLSLWTLDFIMRGNAAWRNSRRAVWFLLAGLVTGLATFTYLGFLPLVGFMALYVLLALVKQHGLHPRVLLAEGAPRLGLYVLGVALPWMLFWLVSRLTPVDILLTSMDNHLTVDRPYLPWLWLHVQDWALFTGVPFVALWLYGTLRSIKARRLTGLSVIGLALLLTMIVIDLSGTTRAETGRVWLLYSPFVLIAAADGLAHITAATRRRAVWAAVTLGQVVLLAALVTSWDVMASDLTPPPDPPGGLMTARPVNADFGGLFRLVNWDAAREDDAIVLSLDWQAAQQVTTPYWFSALLVDPDGVPVAEAVVWQPLDNVYPTTCWTGGEWVGDRIRLPLPTDAAAGDWWISLASFADADAPALRVPVTLPGGGQDTQLGLGPVQVE